MVTIDGAQGEGGGQVLRSALTLSLVTGTPFRIERIRAGRRKPGLLRQHLTAVQAAAQVGQANVRGAEMHSTELTFVPGEVAAGEYHFAIGLNEPRSCCKPCSRHCCGLRDRRG